MSGLTSKQPSEAVRLVSGAYVMRGTVWWPYGCQPTPLGDPIISEAATWTTTPNARLLRDRVVQSDRTHRSAASQPVDPTADGCQAVFFFFVLCIHGHAEERSIAEGGGDNQGCFDDTLGADDS